MEQEAIFQVKKIITIKKNPQAVFPQWRGRVNVGKNHMSQVTVTSLSTLVARSSDTIVMVIV